MLGRASRFLQEGILTPKPLIKIRGRYMIEWALDPIRNLGVEKNCIFIISKDHSKKWALDETLKKIIGKKVHIEIIDSIPSGAAKTVLLLIKHIDNNKRLIIYNSDQFFKSNLKASFKKQGDADGIIPVFKATHPRWSFVDINSHGMVIKTAEKEVISNNATVGLYYFKKGSDFVWGAREMIKKKLMVNGEYYICPVYNELIAKDKKIRSHLVSEMWGLGTPEEVRKFEKYYKGDIF